MAARRLTYDNRKAVSMIEQQILEVRTKIDEITNNVSVSYTGNKHDDTLVAVSADSQRSYWEAKLLDLETLLQSYTYTGRKRNVRAGISVGDVVSLQRLNNKKKLIFRIADRVELYPGEKCISSSSPLGSSVLGRQPGETIAIQTPSGSQQYVILKIEGVA